MNKIKIFLSFLIGVVSAIFSLIYLFNFYAMDACLDMGGKYSKPDNLCTLIPGGHDSYYVSLSNTVIALGIIMGIIITILVSIVLYKLINKLSDNVPNSTA